LPLTKQERFDPSQTPKRILSLDGGGIRGVLTLEYLEVIEETLQKRYANEKLLLCDYFDLIGGTSTGSIIAAGLACGMPVQALKALYRNIGSSVFQSGWSTKFRLGGLLTPKFPAQPLQDALDHVLGADTTLDSDWIKTGLMIMTKRLDTGSPWPIHNGESGAYAAVDGTFYLTQVVRASTAAPTYFEPERIPVRSRDGTVVDAAFVDGGVTPFNDPALQLLMLAALQGHGLCWSTGKDRLLLVSVGTGRYQRTYSTQDLMEASAAEQGLRALQSLIDDCERTNRAVLQWLTNCLTPWIIDRAVGDMKLDSQAGPQLATYARYNVLLEKDWLNSELGIALAPDEITQIARMDDPTNMDDLTKLGQAAALKQVKSEHLPAAFDLARA
jgi:hypothetical protein